MKLKITKLVTDETLYPRNSLNEFVIGRMLSNFDAGAQFPPLTVTAQDYRIVDGWHRAEVYRRRSIDECAIVEKTYLSEADIFADAVRLNIEHGQPLSAYDVRASIARLQQLGYERDQIAAVVRMPATKLDEITRGFGIAQGGSNGPIALKGGLRHMRGQSLSERQQEAQRHYGGHAALFYVRQLALLLDNEMWPTQSDMFAHEMDALAAAWIELRHPTDRRAASA